MKLMFQVKFPQLSVKSTILFILASMALSLVMVPGAAAFVDHGEIATRTLPNGLEVLVREDPAQSVVEVQIWVGAGSRDEPDGQEGIAHLFEHMLFKGTEKRGVGEIAAAIESAGGDINAYTSMDQTVYHITIASDYFLTAMGVLSDAIQNSSFDRGELEREKLVVLEEIRMRNDRPPIMLHQKAMNNAYQKHPYRLPVIGTVESVSSFTRDDIVKYIDKHYYPENITVVVVGDVGAEPVIKKVHDLFGGLAEKDVDVKVLPVNPRGMMVEPFLQILADKLKTCIYEASKTETTK